MRVIERGSGPQRVGTVYALGRNYAGHAREMGATTDPVVFLKPASALRPAGGTIPWPAGCRELHHEVELVLLLGSGGCGLRGDVAASAIRAVAVGVDLTARDLQSEAKRRGWPWARSKGFPGAAPVSEFVPLSRVGAALDQIDLSLAVDGELRQTTRTAEMSRSPAQIIELLSTWFELQTGDLVFTGTPEGVGPIAPGAAVRAWSAVLAVEVRFELAPGP